MTRNQISLALILTMAACGDSSSRDDFYGQCYSEDTANANIQLVQAGQTVCPNIDDVLANCTATDSDYKTNTDTCEITLTGHCAEGYRYVVIMREYAVSFQADSPDYSCDTNGFEPYTN